MLNVQPFDKSINQLYLCVKSLRFEKITGVSFTLLPEESFTTISSFLPEL